MAQLSAAVKTFCNENTLLVDAGDTIQDNFADIFISNADVHPMVQAINALGYDVWVTGNHDYNYGLNVTKRTIRDIQAKVLVGNVYDEERNPLADGYAIFERNGLRIAVIGMVTPNIKRWDAVNLEKCMVTDPLLETRKIIDSLEGKYDVLVGVFHMGIKNEYDTENSGVTDICNACPEFDIMISSHEHNRIQESVINGVLVVQNLDMAQTMSVIDLTLEQTENGWKVESKGANSIAISEFEADTTILSLLEKYDVQAKNDAKEVIGTLRGNSLVPENEIKEIPAAQIQNTALIDLINEVQMYYAEAQVAAAAFFDKEANMHPGDIRKCDVALIYKYPNTLYKLHMTGSQLKKFMEWSARYYNTFQKGDLTISFDPEIMMFNYDIFDGVNYEINIAKESGDRIENLTWLDGTPVRDEDEFDIAVNNYRANTHLLVPGEIYDAEDMPILLKSDVRGDLGGIRELIRDYITNVKKGKLTSEENDNWKITGYEWDEELRAKAVQMLASGDLSIPSSENGRKVNTKSIREEDLRET